MADNACRAIAWAQHPLIPVVKGAAVPLRGVYEGQHGILVHGANGIGNISLPPLTETERRPQSMHQYHDAAEFIVAACTDAPGEIILITLGPLTNLALALARDSTLPWYYTPSSSLSQQADSRAVR